MENPHRVGEALTALGVLALDTNEPSRAHEYFLEALSLAALRGLDLSGGVEFQAAGLA